METLIDPIIFALVPLVTGLVEILKATGLNSKYAPISSLGLGILLTTVLTNDVSAIILGGIVVGLMASGFYSGAKAVLQ
jgi:hypothetical protein